MNICIRKTDGAVFKPSTPPGYSRKQAILEALGGDVSFYFKRIEPLPRRWWQWRTKWIETGEVWEPKSGEFTVKEKNGATDA